MQSSANTNGVIMYIVMPSFSFVLILFLSAKKLSIWQLLDELELCISVTDAFKYLEIDLMFL